MYMYVCTMHIVHFLMVIILDPTLTLANLTPLLERMSSYNMNWWMDIPTATVDMIHSSGGQHGRRCCEVYLSDHPAPSWKQVAHALYRPDLNGQECLEELEVIQKKYLRGESAVGIATCVIIPLLLVSMKNKLIVNICILFYFMIMVSAVAACYVCSDH